MKNIPRKPPRIPHVKGVQKAIPDVVKATPTTGKPKSNLLYYLIVLCCFGNLLPYIITTTVNCANARGFIRQEAFDHLVSVRDIKKKEIENFFNERRGDAYQICHNALFKWVVTSYEEAYRKGGLEGRDYLDVEGRYGGILRGFADAYGYYDVLLVDMQGNVVCSARKHKELGKNILAHPYTDTPLTEAFKRGKTSLTVGDMKWYDVYNGPAQFVSSPLLKEGASEPFGVLILHLDETRINDIMTQRSGLKQSGETYLVGQDLRMRSDSRFTTAASEVLKLKVDTIASREALAGKTDVKIIEDYRGVKVLSAYTPLEIATAIRWALVAEIDKAEALALDDKLINQAVYMTFAMFPIWGAIVFAFYRLIKKDAEAFYGKREAFKG